MDRAAYFENNADRSCVMFAGSTPWSCDNPTADTYTSARFVKHTYLEAVQVPERTTLKGADGTCVVAEPGDYLVRECSPDGRPVADAPVELRPAAEAAGWQRVLEAKAPGDSYAAPDIAGVPLSEDLVGQAVRLTRWANGAFGGALDYASWPFSQAARHLSDAMTAMRVRTNTVGEESALSQILPDLSRFFGADTVTMPLEGGGVAKVSSKGDVQFMNAA